MKGPCFIDVHCHLELIEKPIEEIVTHARSKEIGIIVAQGVNPASNRKVIEISRTYPEVKAALGLYPIDALALSEVEIEKELTFIRDNKEIVSAIGEVGMDFKETEDRERQQRLFEQVVDLSIELDKPIIIHSRKAEKECIEILEKKQAKKVIMHCFSGKLSLVQRIADNKWYLTIPTSVKNSEHFQKVIEMVDISQLLCETDSPYLHPDKLWPNEPANVIESYKKIAEIKKLSVEEVKKTLFENYNRFFNH